MNEKVEKWPFPTKKNQQASQKKNPQRIQEKAPVSTSNKKDVPSFEPGFPEKAEDLPGTTDKKKIDDKKPQTPTPHRKASPGKKKAPSRSKKPPEPEAPYTPYQLVDKPTCKMVASLVPFSILAVMFQNDAYELNEKEKEQLAPLWDKIADKYIPDMISEFSEEASLGITISLILIEKSGVIQSLMAPEGSDKKESENVKS